MSGLRLFLWARWRTWVANLRALLQAPVKLTVLLVMWMALLLGAYGMSMHGMRFLYDTAGLGPFLLSRLWFIFLFVIILLLAASQFASAYSTLVRAPETRYWMTLPVAARTLGRAKWCESSFYTSWAVLLLALPMSLAYLRILDRPWWLIVWVAAVLLAPLVAFMTAASTAALLIWLRLCGRIVIRREVVVIGFVLICAALFWVLGERRVERQEDIWFVALQEVLPRMRIAMSMWLPSRWAATALDAGMTGQWQLSGCYAALLWSSALVAWRALDHLQAVLLLPVLREHAQPVEQGPEGSTGHAPASFVPRGWMRGPWRACLVKDLLFVLRDPMQWSQAVVFFGLLGAYFANIHRIAQMSIEPSWRIGIASMNLACTLLVFGSLAIRFVFPQMSLEGRRLWLLRITPRGMQRLLLAKLLLYGAIALLIVETLLLLSADRLGIPLPIRWWLGAVGVLASVALVGLTVGLGAWWIDPAAEDAARVVSSSNGALVLVAMLGYIGCVIGALGMAWTSWSLASGRGLVAATAGLLVASVAAGVLPVWKGLQRLENLEGF